MKYLVLGLFMMSCHLRTNNEKASLLWCNKFTECNFLPLERKQECLDAVSKVDRKQELTDSELNQFKEALDKTPCATFKRVVDQLSEQESKEL